MVLLVIKLVFGLVVEVPRRFRTIEMERFLGNGSHLEERAVIRCLWDVQNHNMTGNGRPSSSMTEINTARVQEMIQNDQQVTLSEISSELGLSYGRVQHIVSNVLRYSKTML
ncbi:hypothetical protein TNCV_4589141 [Trichonephila clavipes]|nr:hypothetical protein TNCV_4589141 [Trichonephila clavipes]